MEKSGGSFSMHRVFVYIATPLQIIIVFNVFSKYILQVASFHNTLGERMIPSTRPMMLQAALDLSSLVQNQKAVYWDDMEQLANYTDKLKQAVLKLETQVRILVIEPLWVQRTYKTIEEQIQHRRFMQFHVFTQIFLRITS